MNRTALQLLAAFACVFATLMAAPSALAAAGGPPLLDNLRQEGSPGTCPLVVAGDPREAARLELRRVADLDRALREAAATVDRNGDGWICVEARALIDIWPAYVDDSIVFSDWWPPHLACPAGYWFLFLGAYFDPADPLEVYDKNHNRMICKRIPA